MPYTGHPETVPADEVRFLLGDTDPNAPKLSDSEVRYLLSKQEGNVMRAAYQGALRLSTVYGSKASKSVGPTSISYGEQAQFYSNLMVSLGRQGGRPPVGAPVAGGMDTPNVLGDVHWPGQLA